MLSTDISDGLAISTIVATALLAGCIGEPFSAATDADDGEVGAVVGPGDQPPASGGAGPMSGTGGTGSVPSVGGGGGPESCPNPCEQGVCEGGDCRPALSCAELAQSRPALSSGVYSLKPAGIDTAFDAYCDLQTGGVGWTRVLRVQLGQTCTFDVNASDQDPSADESSCAKLSDDLIQALSSERIFFSRVEGYDPMFTKFDGAITATAAPGRVLQRGTYESAQAATALNEITYGYWQLFHQHDFYGPSPCLGGPDGAARLAMEYAVGSGGAYTYAVVGDCATMGTGIDEGHADVFVR